MFDHLGKAFSGAVSKLRGTATLNEDNIKEGLRDVRKALLSADVHFKVVKDFMSRVKERAMGQEVLAAVSPSQQIVKVFHDELTTMMGGGVAELQLNRQNKGKASVILMAGLQGAGKTTQSAKLALNLRKQGKEVMMIAADRQRPAAIDQLEVLGKQLSIPVFTCPGEKNPVKVCKLGLAKAHEDYCDVVIVDTAGRLHIDDDLMNEVEAIAKQVSPDETLLVVDAMTGQDAVNSAKAFDDRLPLTGVILTKLDGDARGGAALSLREVTGKPIKYVGVGEKMDQLEAFHPDRMASRILGMGDVVSLVEKAQEMVSEEEALKLGEKIQKNQFDLDDMLDQMRKMKKMGPLKNVLSLLPGVGQALKDADLDQGEAEMRRVEAMICSMTLRERQLPDAIDSSRKRRIAAGSGTTTSQVNQLLKNFKQMRKMMKSLSGGPGALKKLGQMPF